jgi:hypothetical protein
MQPAEVYVRSIRLSVVDMNWRIRSLGLQQTYIRIFTTRAVEESLSLSEKVPFSARTTSPRLRGLFGALSLSRSLVLVAPSVN